VETIIVITCLLVAVILTSGLVYFIVPKEGNPPKKSAGQSTEEFIRIHMNSK
jgi:hypothetical protein